MYSTRFVSVFGVCVMTIAVIAAPERGNCDELRISSFNVDVTPPMGSPLAYAPLRSVSDPLYARGIVLTGSGKPIVLCAVDWLNISNSGHDLWREKLAASAGTTTDRVSVHVLHQHDAPRCDFRAEEILASIQKGNTRFDSAFAYVAIEKTATAVRECQQHSQPVTHIGIGEAEVKQVASNRRILGEDGNVSLIRMSKCTNPKAIAAPEGIVDRELKLVSFWMDDHPIVVLTYFATHPQSYYGKGDASSDFVGLARATRDAAIPGTLHVHFNGAGGDVAAGKYNDGSPEMRPILTERLASGMRAAWENVKRIPVTTDDVEWSTTIVQIPVAPHLTKESLLVKIGEETRESLRTFAPKLSWVERATESQVPMQLSLLRISNVYLLHAPGELFVEYQLAAQKMRPDGFVCMAAYGDLGPGYVGTQIAYSQGGYETQPDSSNVSPQAEKVLLDGFQKLLTPESMPESR